MLEPPLRDDTSNPVVQSYHYCCCWFGRGCYNCRVGCATLRLGAMGRVLDVDTGWMDRTDDPIGRSWESAHKSWREGVLDEGRRASSPARPELVCTVPADPTKARTPADLAKPILAHLEWTSFRRTKILGASARARAGWPAARIDRSKVVPPASNCNSPTVLIITTPSDCTIFSHCCCCCCCVRESQLLHCSHLVVFISCWRFF